jgi:hypothetical protein
MLRARWLGPQGNNRKRPKGGTVLAMDQISSAEFSPSSLHLKTATSRTVQRNIPSKFAATTGRGRGGKARILFLAADDTLKIFARTKNNGGCWVLEKSVPAGLSTAEQRLTNRSSIRRRKHIRSSCN